LNVYKEDYDRKGASFKIILFILATTCYTAFLYSGARCAMCDTVSAMHGMSGISLLDSLTNGRY
jgi:hypothetical protein